MSDTLIERCREVLNWKNTGVLTGGALRAFRNERVYADWPNALDMAGSETATEAMRSLIDASDRIATLERELDLCHQTIAGWIAANGPGGWIDEMRQQLFRMRRQRDACDATPADAVLRDILPLLATITGHEAADDARLEEIERKVRAYLHGDRDD